MVQDKESEKSVFGKSGIKKGLAMLALHPEYVIDEYHKPKAVLLPFDEWQQVLESLEDSDDIRVYDEAKTKELSFIPFEQAIEEIQSGKIE